MKLNINQAIIHKVYEVNTIPVHVAEAGQKGKSVIFFIHGWPTNWEEFSSVMLELADEYHVFAIDLPGIGESKVPLQSYRKDDVAKFILDLIEGLNLRDITLVGCDLGGQIVYACLKNKPECITHAVIMNVAIPGVKPWEQVKNNPYAWHFKFHIIPNLPETLVTGRELDYFSYFYNILVAKGNHISDELKSHFAEAYSNPIALKAGFDLYRSLPEDEQDNIETKGISISISVCYLRGADEPVNIETYVEGFKENGFEHIETAIIKQCGHFSAIEQPQEVADAIKRFIKRTY